jgi:hypothetical protein
MPYFNPFPVPDESDLRRFGGGAQDCCPQMHQNRRSPTAHSGSELIDCQTIVVSKTPAVIAPDGAWYR